MSDELRRAFAEITVRLEDMHGIALEGQRPGNSADMHQALGRQLWCGVLELRGKLRRIAAVIDGSGG